MRTERRRRGGWTRRFVISLAENVYTADTVVPRAFEGAQRVISRVNCFRLDKKEKKREETFAGELHSQL